MTEKPDYDAANLSETMAARFEINNLEDPTRQKQITDAIVTLEGAIEVRIENGALHVSYDPLTTSEKKIEEAIRSTRSSVEAAATDTEGAHPDLPMPANQEEEDSDGIS